VRAALLYGPGDLRVREVPEPEGEVVVEIRAASACGTDTKMLRHGHRILGGYPCRLGHETAGVRADTGEPVLVGDSVACETCAPCCAGRRQLCRDMTWILGGFAERIAAPAAALHAIPEGLPFAAAAMAEPLAAAVHALARTPSGADVGVLGGGTMGQFLARLALLEGRRVTLADHHPERRRQAERLGARAVELLGSHDVVLEAVGRVEAWEAALAAVAPGGCLVLVGGCPAGTAVSWPTAPLHYDEVDVRGAFHHDRAEVDRALALLAAGEVPWEAFRGETVRLEGLGEALARPAAGEARKLVVEPGAGG